MAKKRDTGKQGDRTRAVAYLRVSTEEQTLGPEAQRAAIVAWCAQNGVSIVSTHSDAGISGGSDLADRMGLTAAIGDLRILDAGLLVIARRDRLARDVYVAAVIDRAVALSGARVACADGTANGSTPADDFLRTILDAVAAYERALIRSRTRAALAIKRARGERAGNIPFGSAATAAGMLITDENEMRILARAQALRSDGETLRTIEFRLAYEGFVGRSGRPLTRGSLDNLVRKGLLKRGNASCP